VGYDHLFFCEGAQLKNNPWFGQLPLVGTKGEMLVIRCAELPQTAIWKGPVFIVPLGEGIFWVGASFDWEEKNNVPTDNGRF
ncbi:MAG: FAD-dependent oxidoreductase, partial [Flavobacteriaceae bacterium]